MNSDFPKLTSLRSRFYFLVLEDRGIWHEKFRMSFSTKECIVMYVLIRRC